MIGYSSVSYGGERSNETTTIWPDAAGAKAAKFCANAGIPTTVVLESAVGYVMERSDLVVVGAEGMVENGGIVNKMGMYAMGIAVRELGKPLYIDAESYKFARLFPSMALLEERPDAAGAKAAKFCANARFRRK